MNAADQPSDSLVGPTIVWSGVQLITLFIATAHFPIWLAEPKPYEQFALHIVAIEQLILAAMLSPVVCATWTRSATTALISIPFLLLAGVAASSTSGSVVSLVCLIVEWLAVLAIVQSISLKREFRSVIAATATLLVVGTAILDYLSADLSFTTSHHQGLHSTNLISAASGIASSESSHLPHLTLFCTIIALATIRVGRARKTQRQVIHNDSQQYVDNTHS